MSAHHLFAPSAAHRWMVCVPSTGVARGYPRSTSYDAAEGTVAHSMAATCLMAGIDADTVWSGIETVSEEGFDIPVTLEMRGYVQTYLDYVRALPGALRVEERMEFAAEHDFGGTSDALVWDMLDRVLHVTDFKYGKGVRVNAEKNLQGMCYALLAIAQAGDMIDVDKVVIHIHQPRIDNVSSWTISVDDLVKFATKVSMMIAQGKATMKSLDKGIALPASDFTPGDHCKFCPHAAKCPGLAEFATKTAQMVFGSVSEVETKTLGEILKHADIIDAWVAAVRQEAVDRALKGETVDGFKLVQKRPMRKWIDEEKVKEAALDSLVNVLAPPAVMSPAQLEAAHGKKFVAETFGSLITSQSSGLTLVGVDDKRPAVDPLQAAGERAQAVFGPVE